MLELVNALGWDRFTVLGGSGGGPHALALAVRAPERIIRLGLVGCAAPAALIDDTDLTESNREGRRRSQLGRPILESFMSEPAKRMKSDPSAMFAAAMKDAPAIDRSMLERPEVQLALNEQLREAFVNGPEGWFDDAWVLTQPWGFDLEVVTVPLWIWHGELDRNSPLSAVRRMNEQLHCVQSFKVFPEQGHLCILREEENILRALLA
jgi:pimeloyl-ACP methyl ester carboxylesterase